MPTRELLSPAQRAQFSRHFTHLQTGDPAKDRTALFAALLADAINLGLTKMAEACTGRNLHQSAGRNH